MSLSLEDIQQDTAARGRGAAGVRGLRTPGDGQEPSSPVPSPWGPRSAPALHHAASGTAHGRWGLETPPKGWGHPRGWGHLPAHPGVGVTPLRSAL